MRSLDGPGELSGRPQLGRAEPRLGLGLAARRRTIGAWDDHHGQLAGKDDRVAGIGKPAGDLVIIERVLADGHMKEGIGTEVAVVVIFVVDFQGKKVFVLQ